MKLSTTSPTLVPIGRVVEGLPLSREAKVVARPTRAGVMTEFGTGIGEVPWPATGGCAAAAHEATKARPITKARLEVRRASRKNLKSNLQTHRNMAALERHLGSELAVMVAWTTRRPPAWIGAGYLIATKIRRCCDARYYRHPS